MFPRQVSRLNLHVLVALSGIGCALSSYLVYAQYRLHRDPLWRSACSLGDAFDCERVITSAEGTVAGLPLSLWGALFYGVTAAVAMLSLRRSAWRFRSPALILLSASAGATALSIRLGYVSLHDLGAVCPICLVLYCLNAVMFCVALLGQRRTGEPFRRAVLAEVRYWSVVPARLVALLAAGVAMLWATRFVYSRAFDSSPAVCLAAARGDSVPDPVELVVFSDFQCRHCRLLDRDLRTLRENPRLSVVQLYFPLDASCNPDIVQTRHRGACLQAAAALCAQEQAHGAELRNVLFDEGLDTKDEIVSRSAALGLERDRLQDCLDGEEGRSLLALNMAQALLAGVRGVPTVFFDGRPHFGRFSDEEMGCLRVLAGR